MVRLTRRRLLGSLAAMGLAYTLPGIAVSRGLSVTRLSLGLGFRVAALADMHIHYSPRRDVVEAVSGIDPDLVLVLGDLFDALTRSLDPVRETLRGLVRVVGLVYGVMGNHEHRAAGVGKTREVYESTGARLLVDESDEPLPGLLLLGVDWRSEPSGYAEAFAELAGEAEGYERVLVAMHSPDAAPHAPRLGAAMFAGHTHGGQVCLPGARPLATNSVYGYTWGLYRVNGNVLYVSRGLGEMFPPRLYCPRQMVVAE